ncbi:hypothetical protein LEP1GSC050_3015 [Leptospira broomii serovar Hurstbridge str. 5399]|uniref:Uncharacterized protein n=1 Tax=Leptospira broomii serovar Hurstbridge str. 5399 TaxID=1049789 RepID=T0FAA2_9LEPT|nr:hypothetical protein LEP1GSC050_3015 [Leptospira broomii serovar Hurstbridge str. 5399]
METKEREIPTDGSHAAPGALSRGPKKRETKLYKDMGSK